MNPQEHCPECKAIRETKCQTVRKAKDLSPLLWQSLKYLNTLRIRTANSPSFKRPVSLLRSVPARLGNHRALSMPRLTSMLLAFIDPSLVCCLSEWPRIYHSNFRILCSGPQTASSTSRYPGPWQPAPLLASQSLLHLL